MRKSDRQLTSPADLLALMRRCEYCTLALHGGDYPYVVPLNFGVALADGVFTLYFHCAHEGAKLALIARDNRAAFQMTGACRLITGDKACRFTMEYESICGNGSLEIVPAADKLAALTIIMKQYSDAETFEFDAGALERTTVLKLTVNEITGKRLKL